MVDFLNTSSNGHHQTSNNDGINNAATSEDSQFGNSFKTPLSRKTSKQMIPKNKTSFYNELLQFHEKIGTPIVRFPRISGKEIDLHLLYSVTVNRGGWHKVNLKDDWAEVMGDLGISNKCLNSMTALKQIYVRYLERYERIHFFGEIIDRMDDENDETEPNRHRKLSTRSLHSVPQSYNYSQHNLPDPTRFQHQNGKKKSTEYDKLLLALLSPLPNEQDFAINVCTLMSSEGKHSLRLKKSPQILNALLAHAGIFHNRLLREIFTEYYSKFRKYALDPFWRDCLLNSPDCFALTLEDVINDTDTQDVLDIPSYNGKLSEYDSLLPFLEEEEFLNISNSQHDYLSLNRELGTHEYIGQRIMQIAQILRNLSFDPENCVSLMENRSFLRFVVLLSNTQWNNLIHSGLDILGNIASELELEDPTIDHLTRCLMATVIEGIVSLDRGVVISCLEILNKFCQKECNEEIIHKCMDAKTYEQICAYLCLNDIMLLLYALECIYSLSSLGEKSCNRILHVRGIIDTLVSLVTVEAQSYGPDGCILMRVVETIPANVSVNAKHSQSSNLQYSQMVTQQLSIQNEPISSIPATITVQQSPDITSQIQLSRSPGVSFTCAPPESSAISSTSEDLASPGSVIKHTPEDEQFALAWLKSSVELAQNLSSSIEQQELYKMYVGACQKAIKRRNLSLANFSRCVRTIFGGTVGPNQIKTEPNSTDAAQYHFEGLKLKISVQPVSQGSQTQPTATLLQQVLQNTGEKSITTLQQSANVMQNQNAAARQKQTPPTTIANVPKSAATSVKTPTQPVMTTTVSGNTSTSSMIIKSLLANKVTTTDVDGNVNVIATTNSSALLPTNANVHQVTQRQLMHKQIAEQRGATNQGVPSTLNNSSIVVNANNLNNATTVKLGTSTISIKPGTLPNNTVITASNSHEKMIESCRTGLVINPPPLAPLSSSSGKTILHTKIDDHHTMKKDDKLTKSEIDEANSQKLHANKMLTDLLEKKSDPPIFELPGKRKIDAVSDPFENQTSAKRMECVDLCDDDDSNKAREQTHVKKAADLYAELAGSILEDEEMEEAVAPPTDQKLLVAVPKPTPQPKQVIAVPMPMQRQIVVSQNNQGQMILSPNQHQTQVQQQGMPILVQHSGQPNVQIQKQNAPGGKIVQLASSQCQPQQYILATNAQGQTYVVAQPTNPPLQQALLVAQASQQHGTQAKTIIILQPQGGQNVGVTSSNTTQTTQQKLIMTTSPRQQLLVTQTNTRQQIIVNQAQTQGGILRGQGQNAQKIFITRDDKQPQQVLIHQKEQGQQSNQIVVQQSPSGSQQSIINISPPKINQIQITPSHLQSNQIMLQAYTTNSPTIHNTVQQQQNQKTSTHQIVIQKQSNVGNQVFKTPGVTVTQTTIPPVSSANIVHASSSTPQMQVKATALPPKLASQEVITVTDDNEEDVPNKAEEKIDSQTSETSDTASSTSTGGNQSSGSHIIQMIPAMDPAKITEEDVEPDWLWVCDWRGCPKKKFKSANEVYLHACAVHCPETIDAQADIYCQWGPGPNFCDNLPRKRFSLMTHVFDRHCMPDSFHAAVQRRMTNSETENATPRQPYPVTLIRQPVAQGANGNPEDSDKSSNNTLTPVPLQQVGSAALQAIKRHSTDISSSKELNNTTSNTSYKQISSLVNSDTVVGSKCTQSGFASSTVITSSVNTTGHFSKSDQTNVGAGLNIARDDNEGPVTKSIRLTAALILRNLVNYSQLAKRNLRSYEPHLAYIALSNVESSRTIAQVLYEMNEVHPI